ncbi:MAG: SUMF1/EgtB/PvdO family nonheme iron enzyme [Candidatus Competibacteraceae bacterium]|jgi:formylglycine-generating enzyme required for sulfatase activity|nr:SUMF1/EgtB/PvdO family nonheme iron enzyme [Candidatus Competibacteraceae bacterium]
MSSPTPEPVSDTTSELAESAAEPGYYTGPTPTDEAEARIAYCRTIAQRCVLALPGGREPNPDSAQHWPNLERVFVEPNAQASPIKKSAENPSAATIPLFDTIEQNRRLVVLGSPGSGKTTLLKRLGLAFAGACWQGLERWPENGRDWLPVLVSVQKFACWLQAKPALPDAFAALLWAYIIDDLDQRGLGFAEEVLAQAADKGQALVLLDDLDSVPESLQRTVLDTITDFAKSYHRARLLVTCSLEAYSQPGERLPERRFPTMELAAWDHHQIDHFIRACCADLAARHASFEEQVPGLINSFYWAVEWSKRTLPTVDPLLLSLIGAGIDQRQNPPEQSAWLFAQAVDRLLQQHPALLSFLQETELSVEDLLWVLGRIAVSAWELEEDNDGCNRPLHLSSDYLVEALTELHPETDRDWACRLLDRVRETGLLVEHQPGLYRFLHPVISNYLAGIPLALASDFVKQGLKLTQTHWAQARCLLPLAAMTQARQNHQWKTVWTLVDELCKDNSEENIRAIWLAGEVMLAIGCEAINQHDGGDEKLIQVTQQLTALLEQGRLAPDERVQAAECLGSLGDPRFGQKRLYLPSRYQQQEERGLGFVTIPASSFWMGSSDDDPDADLNELGNTNPLLIPYAYWMARYPVTVAQYSLFVDRNGYAADAAWWQEEAAKAWLDTVQRDKPVAWEAQRQHPNRPVTGISWFEARAYCSWLDDCLRKTRNAMPADYEIRLPSEAEWEKAARCASRNPYPWGTAAWELQHANLQPSLIGHPTPVGLYPQGATVNGLHDLAGNVWEWTLSGASQYPYQSHHNSLQEQQQRIARGGAWNVEPMQARCAARAPFDASEHNAALGFRVVISVMHSPFSPQAVF